MDCVRLDCVGTSQHRNCRAAASLLTPDEERKQMTLRQAAKAIMGDAISDTAIEDMGAQWVVVMLALECEAAKRAGKPDTPALREFRKWYDTRVDETGRNAHGCVARLN